MDPRERHHPGGKIIVAVAILIGVLGLAGWSILAGAIGDRTGPGYAPSTFPTDRRR